MRGSQVFSMQLSSAFQKEIMVENTQTKFETTLFVKKDTYL